jgi:hypothetical protein
MRASVTIFLLSFFVVVLGVQPTAAQNDSWFPSLVQGVVGDCITHPSDLGGPNTLYPEPPDSPTQGCDSYDPDLLERPVTQFPGDDLSKYFAWVDIDTAWAGQDADWIYVGIGIRGLKDGNTMDAKPFFEIDFDEDGRGDLIVLHEGGKNPDDFDGSFTSATAKPNEKLSAFTDTDDSVGGADPNAGDGPGGQGDGYDTETWKTGDTPDDGCAVRQIIRASGFPRFDFACQKSVVGDPGGNFAFRATINRGSNDFANFTLNDTYDAAAYGSPYSANANYTSSNSYEMDNTLWSTIDLPVELGAFDVIRSSDEMVLTWTTLSETNNSGFEVQHSIGTKPFEPVAFVPGAGTTRDVKTYTYRYLTEEPGVHRFRLKQIDFDGAFAYSQAVEVAVDLPERFVLEAAYPNPFNPSTTIRFGIAEAGRVSVRLYDALGREVRVLFAGTPIPNEMHSVTIEAGGLPSGSYVVRLEGSSYVATRMITLLK